MIPSIKICGLSSSEAVSAAVEGGATHLGFIFFGPSPRNIDVGKAADLARSRKEAAVVAVTVDAEDEFLDEIVNVLQPDMLQLHGREPVQRVEEVKARYSLPVMKALAVRETSDVEKARTYDGTADILLLDAKPPKGSELPGGNGVSFNWSLVETLKTRAPILLSGGIDNDNLQAALDYVADDRNSLAGIDVSSGVESAPGVKDIAKITAFLKACRGHGRQIA